MSAAWEVTEEDIQIVLNAHTTEGIGNRVIGPDRSAESLLNLIDPSIVAWGALWGDDMAQQQEYALGAIEQQIIDLGVISEPRMFPR